MADADTERLKKILTETYRNQAKDKQVKDAIRKRIADKKKVKKGGSKAVDKFTAHNLKAESLSEAAAAAATKKHTGAGSDKVTKPKEKKEEVKKKKKDVFSVGLAAKNVLQMKDKGY